MCDLILACFEGKKRDVERLLREALDPNYRDSKGKCPLHYVCGSPRIAVDEHREKIVDLLLAAEADIDIQSERSQNTPLHIAVNRKNQRLVYHLLRRGANRNICNIDGDLPQNMSTSPMVEDTFCNHIIVEPIIPVSGPQIILEELEPTSPNFKHLCRIFDRTWAKDRCTDQRSVNLGRRFEERNVERIFSLRNVDLSRKFEEYKLSLVAYNDDVTTNERVCWHGTTSLCQLKNGQLCDDERCALCSICRNGFLMDKVKSQAWQRFGCGLYFAPNSSKAHDYARLSFPEQEYRRVLLSCRVALGKSYKTIRNEPQMKPRPPMGFNSVHGQLGSNLNYDEFVVYEDSAAIPDHIILYRYSYEGPECGRP